MIGGSLFSLISPIHIHAACDDRFLGFPAWYSGLTEGSDCKVVIDDLSSDIWRIVLNILEMGLIAVGYLALFFLLYAGFMFITANGSSDKIVKAKNMILQAVIGLVLSIASIGIVNLIMSIIE